MAALLIGDVAERAGVTPPTIRYYETIGLLKGPARSNSGYRRYPEHTIDELRFIRQAQGLGFSLSEVAEILRLTRAGKAPCDRVFALVRQHLAAIDTRIRQLQAFRGHLEAELAKWTTRTDTMRDGVCQIIATSALDTDDIPIDVREPRSRRRSRRSRRSTGETS